MSAGHSSIDFTRLFTAIALGATAAGCYVAPSCEEALQKIEVPIRGRVTLTGDRSFRVAGGEPTTCEALCRSTTGATHVESCGLPVAADESGSVWGMACEVDVVSCEYAKVVDIGSGRRHTGFALPFDEKRGVGAALARMAALEAASVPAFRRLARELTCYGAPAALVAEATQAAKDEARHARIVARLARARGAAPVFPRVGPLVVRSLEDLACENIVEGCVNESFGAFVAAFQRERAACPDIRVSMTCIARDEARHAHLSFRVLAWTLQSASATVRQRHLDRFQSAIARLRALLDRLDGSRGAFGASAEAAIALGLPDRETAIAAFHALRASLWDPTLRELS